MVLAEAAHRRAPTRHAISRGDSSVPRDVNHPGAAFRTVQRQGLCTATRWSVCVVINGLPKGVMLTPRNLIIAIRELGRHLRVGERTSCSRSHPSRT